VWRKPLRPLLLAANSNGTFAYTGQLGLGVIGTTLSQPMPRLSRRLTEYVAALGYYRSVSRGRSSTFSANVVSICQATSG
jgi:hypothetical protein